MFDLEFERTMEDIIVSLKEAGYEPYEQLVGYVKSGNTKYITRLNDARVKIQNLNREKILLYLKEREGDDIGKTI